MPKDVIKLSTLTGLSRALRCIISQVLDTTMMIRYKAYALWKTGAEKYMMIYMKRLLIWHNYDDTLKGFWALKGSSKYLRCDITLIIHHMAYENTEDMIQLWWYTKKLCISNWSYYHHLPRKGWRWGGRLM